MKVSDLIRELQQVVSDSEVCFVLRERVIDTRTVMESRRLVYRGIEVKPDDTFWPAVRVYLKPWTGQSIKLGPVTDPNDVD